MENNGGSPPLTYSLFNQVASAVGDPPKPEGDPDWTKVKFRIKVDHDTNFGIPSSEKLGKLMSLMLMFFPDIGGDVLL